MSDPNPLGERGKPLEDECFRRRGRELIERLRATAAADVTRRELATLTGLEGADLAALEALGLTPDTIALLPLVPLLQIAWAEGGVTERERELILQFARSRGVTEGSPGDTTLSGWLLSPPSGDVYAGALRLVRVMLDESGALQGLSDDELLNYGERIAAASGGVFGGGRISDDERALLAAIAGNRRAPQE